MHLLTPNKGKFLLPCNMFAWLFSWLPLSSNLLAYPPPRLPWPEDTAIGINTDGCPSKQASTILFSSEFPASWGKNLAIPIDQTPDEGGEPAGSFCNLPLTWTQDKGELECCRDTASLYAPTRPPGCLLSSTEALLSRRGTHSLTAHTVKARFQRPLPLPRESLCLEQGF